MTPNPDFMAELESEAEYARKGNRPDRMKIEPGEGMIVRFIPVQVSQTGAWFGRVGRHWFNRKHVNCPRTTSAAMGGSPDADCPVCRLSETLVGSAEKALQETGKKLEVWPKFLTYALPLAYIDKRGDEEPVKKRDMYTAQALWLPRTAFTELDRIIKKSMRHCEGGLVDPLNGFAVEVRVDARKNWRLELIGDPCPLRDDMAEDAMITWFYDLCAQVKVEDTKAPSYEDLQAFATNIERQLAGMGDEAAAAPRRGRYTEGDEDTAPRPRRAAAEEGGYRRPAATRPAARNPYTTPAPLTPAQQQVARELDSQPFPGAEQPQDDQAVAEEQAAEAAAVTQPVRQAPARPAPLPRTAARPAPAPVAARPALTPPPARRIAAPIPVARGTPPPEEPASATDEESLPPETRDPAPPIDEPPAAPLATAPRAAAPRPVARRELSSALQSTLRKGI